MYYCELLLGVFSQSNHVKLLFLSIFAAEIGPPGLELQSMNGIVKVKVSPPEANQRKKMWINDLSFKYNLVFWKNSSHAQV